MTHKLAFIGFGGVGQGLAEILLERQQLLTEQFALETQVVAICDVRKGTLYDPHGLDMEQVLRVVQESGSLHDYHDPEALRNWDSIQTIERSEADTIVEVTYTDTQTGQPAIDHCRRAFQTGKNVVTTNKGPLALAYEELQELARENHVRWGYEGTVMSGTPALRLPLTTLAGNHISEIRGILNGTTNYMITKMEEGLTYEEALAEAKAQGYAEADPTNDVEGYDAMYKVMILANLVLDIPLKKEDVSVQGLTHLTPEEIQQAQSTKQKWKMLARIQKDNDQVLAQVKPEKISVDDPLAPITGATNAITYHCDLAGPITLIGAGAGKTETGFSLLIDLINIHRNTI